MTHVLVLLLALLIGVVAGLRALTPPAVVAWGAFLGWINLAGTWASWMASWITVTVLTILLVVELITDQLPKTPSRKTTAQFATRLITGAFAGAAIGTAWGYTLGGLGAGVVGAVLGTLGGYEARSRLVKANGGRDLPVALVEDVIAVGGGFLVVYLTSVL
ncbi:putative integral membrane protein [Mycolicibacterium rhodesiae JS60]|nr:putative integral membrane protein [Mycolicibacterium rhodesiae JS60]